MSLAYSVRLAIKVVIIVIIVKYVIAVKEDAIAVNYVINRVMRATTVRTVIVVRHVSAL